MRPIHSPSIIPGQSACTCGWRIQTLDDAAMFQPWKDHARERGMSEQLIRTALFELTSSIFAS